MQGDVVRIYTKDGEVVAHYTYDAWGKLLAITYANGAAITDSTNPAVINPIRYRGYYYDSETGFYYLNSRYYDPGVGRFLNSDDMAFLGISGTVLGYNLFGYCENEPVNNIDVQGYYSLSFRDFKSDWAGREILYHYLYGKGKGLYCKSVKWGNYIGSSKLCACCGYTSSKTLNEYIEQYILNLYYKSYAKAMRNYGIGKQIYIQRTLNVSLENGEGIIGYNYLHGVNMKWGGLKLKIYIKKLTARSVSINFWCDWNDYIDPNYIYDSDSYKAKLANYIPFAKPKNYYICISWGPRFLFVLL